MTTPEVYMLHIKYELAYINMSIEVGCTKLFFSDSARNHFFMPFNVLTITEDK